MPDINEQLMLIALRMSWGPLTPPNEVFIPQETRCAKAVTLKVVRAVLLLGRDATHGRACLHAPMQRGSLARGVPGPVGRAAASGHGICP